LVFKAKIGAAFYDDAARLEVDSALSLIAVAPHFRYSLLGTELELSTSLHSLLVISHWPKCGVTEQL